MSVLGLEAGSASRRLDIERMFVMGTCNHEHLFGVKTFSERVFAFWVHTSYRLANRCSITFGIRYESAFTDGSPTGFNC